MKSTSAALVAAGIWCATGILNAANGVVITQKTTSGGETRTSQVQLDQHHMRAEIHGTSGRSDLVIFDGAKQVLDIVHPDAKTYNEITKADMDQLASQVSGAMAQMQAAMANMPPERRAQIEAAMKGRMGGAGAAAPAKPEYRKAGTAQVGKWTCQKYDGYENGQKTSEVCTVEPSALGFSLSDFAVTQDMMNFMSGLRRMMPNANQLFTVGTIEAQGYSGIPVQMKHNVGGQEYVTELSDITRTSIPDSAFAVPAGMQKQPLMGMGRGRQ